MKGERLFRILGLIDEALIEEAEAVVPRRSFRWKGALAAAACVAILCGLVWRSGGLPIGGFGGSSGSSSSSSSTGGSSAGMDSGAADSSPEESGAASTEDSYTGIDRDSEPQSGEGIAFMSYAGPVFPLTTLEAVDGLTAARHTVWDFAPGSYRDGSPRQWGAVVADGYTLTNTTAEDITVTAAYPFAGSFADLDTLLPEATVDGAAAEAALQAGPYTGGFRDAGVDDGSTWNLDYPDSWTDYKALLEDGAYLEQAFGAYPDLDLPVTVYGFTELTAPEGYDAATQAIEFTIDPNKTTILTYGINGSVQNVETGWRQYSYFVPGTQRREEDLKLLVVLGEDIGDYTLTGYKDGGCDPGEELEGVSCSVTRYETTLDAVLNELCRLYMERYARDRQIAPETSDLFALVSHEMFSGAAAELLAQYGILAGEGMADRYSDGRLDDILSETLTQQRVLYLAVPVTVPAGGSVDLTFSLWKEPSYDFGCSGTEYAGLQGYDFVTTLGSNLRFTAQTAALLNTEGVEVVSQNFGFDLANGVTEAALALAEEHYYLEIRPK